MNCPYCAHKVADARFCTDCGGMLSHAAGPACVQCGHALRRGAAFCIHCGARAKLRDAFATQHVQMLPWRNGKPRLALALSALFPGAGQALNGQLGKGVLFLLLAPLLIPWVWGCYDAYETARVRGMRGGWGHVALHLWLVTNVVLVLVLVLSIMRIL